MKKLNIIGRSKELEILKDIERSKEAEFLAVYGRRRVGKTFLIRELFSRRGVYLEVTGLKGASLQVQLKNFAAGISRTFFKGVTIPSLSSWSEAFELLSEQVRLVSRRKKVVIFLDELPWLATKKSGLIQAIDYYWNTCWSKLDNIILIVCGSAASWMLDHLVHAKGGLYNRITKRILLEPFDLSETRQFLSSRSVNMSEKQVLDLYMAVGGIPFYLKEVKKGKSASQTIQDLCFKKSGLLHTEFKNLFYALFDQAELNLRICRAILKGGNMLSRESLIKAVRGTSGGAMNRRLYELEASGFIRCFVPYGKKRRGKYYRLVDEYTLFYIKWIEPLLVSGTYSDKESYWQKVLSTSSRLSWAGYAFESVCLKHIHQVSRALGLDEVAFHSGTWSFFPKKGSSELGAQIDLLFDREDGVITLCEIKYSDKLFSIDKAYFRELDKKIDVFQEKSKTKKQLFLAMITTRGIKRNLWSEDLIQSEVTLGDLFT